MFSRATLALFFGSCALALSACGGSGSGSSGGALPVSAPTSNALTSQPTAAPTTTPGSTSPLSPGQSFVYNGTLLQTQFRSQPAPMPTATTLVTVQQNGTVKDQQSYNGATGLYDGSVAETDTTALQTSTSQTDTYYGFSSPSPTGATELLEYGSTWADDNSDTLTYTYPAPLILDNLPETSGAAWTNSPAVTILENDSTDANGSAFFSDEIINADGSYSETTTYPPAYGPADSESVITENGDGSGSITGVDGAGAVVFGTPQPQGNGTYLLPFSVYAVPSPSPSTAPLESGTVNAWYTIPITLYHETDNDLGSQQLPSACNVPSSIATSATEVQRAITRVDTMLGYIETQTTSEYRVPSFGAVCVLMNDTQNQYYDWNGDTQFIFSASSIQTNTIVEALTLTSGASAADAKRRVTAKTASVTPLSTQTIAAAQMRFEERVRQLRAQTKLNLARSFKSYLANHKGASL